MKNRYNEKKIVRAIKAYEADAKHSSLAACNRHPARAAAAFAAFLYVCVPKSTCWSHAARGAS